MEPLSVCGPPSSGAAGVVGLLLGRRGGLGVRAGQRQEKRTAGGEEKDAGRMVRMDGHHLKLYSVLEFGRRGWASRYGENDLSGGFRWLRAT